jgi:hypothetical protein
MGQSWIETLVLELPKDAGTDDTACVREINNGKNTRLGVPLVDLQQPLPVVAQMRVRMFVER